METGSGTHKRGRQPAVTGNEAACRPRRCWVARPLGSVVPTAIGAVLIVAMVAAACGTIKPAATTTTAEPPSTSPSLTSTTTTLAGNLGLFVPTRQTAIAGFLAALKVIDAADRSVDPNYPALAQTEVKPALTQSQDFLTALRLNHDTVRGPSESLGHPVIVSYSPTRAVVQTCSPAGGAITYGANGKPLPGVLGSAPAAVLTGVMVPGEQNWMLQDFAVKVVASCPAS